MTSLSWCSRITLHMLYKIMEQWIVDATLWICLIGLIVWKWFIIINSYWNLIKEIARGRFFIRYTTCGCISIVFNSSKEPVFSYSCNITKFPKNLSWFSEYRNYNGSRVNPDNNKEKSCTTKSATWVSDKNGERRQVCPRQLIFEETFDNLNATNWNFVQRFSGVTVRMITEDNNKR